MCPMCCSRWSFWYSFPYLLPYSGLHQAPQKASLTQATHYSKKSCPGLETGLHDFNLWADFPTELNSPTKLGQKAPALSFLPSQTGEVNQITGTTALQTQRGKGTSVCRKYPLLLCVAFSRPWTTVYYYLLLRQCCLFMGCWPLGCKRWIIPQPSSWCL